MIFFSYMILLLINPIVIMPTFPSITINIDVIQYEKIADQIFHIISIRECICGYI